MFRGMRLNDLVFPARAGMIRNAKNPRPTGRGIPRESGDDPRLIQARPGYTLYSPRERG